MIVFTSLVKFLSKSFIVVIFLSGLNTFGQKSINVIAVGDIMMGTDYPRNRLPVSDGKYLMQDVENILKSADVTFGNLEGALVDGGKARKQCKDTSKCYLFRTPTKYARNLANSGFDLLSLANNHSFDFGRAGYNSTADILGEYGIKFAGEAGSSAILVHDDIKIGLLAYAPNYGCTSLLHLRTVVKQVKELNKKCDILLVSFHGGAEGREHMNIPGGMEYYYGEQRGDVIKFAHSVIDAGADLVIGHGPHVPRAIELYKNKLVAYSLGNFCTYKGFSVNREKGLAPILSVELNEQGDFLEGEIISARQLRPRGPVLDKTNEAAELISKLTKQDFPETPLTISVNGKIQKTN
jgi:poly-gamma-glutamate capsule biosynthesis protein CapA/YwtB (metallophosphatase superfamily)